MAQGEAQDNIALAKKLRDLTLDGMLEWMRVGEDKFSLRLESGDMLILEPAWRGCYCGGRHASITIERSDRSPLHIGGTGYVEATKAICELADFLKPPPPPPPPPNLTAREMLETLEGV